jgi:hypothetical protein
MVFWPEESLGGVIVLRGLLASSAFMSVWIALGGQVVAFDATRTLMAKVLFFGITERQAWFAILFLSIFGQVMITYATLRLLWYQPDQPWLSKLAVLPIFFLLEPLAIVSATSGLTYALQQDGYNPFTAAPYSQIDSFLPQRGHAEHAHEHKGRV